MSAGTPYIGSKISLISKAEIRYEGTLYAVDTNESTVTLQKVKSFGTENRPAAKHVPPRSEIYEYIIFRGSDIKDLHVSEVNKQEEQPSDPAILSKSAPVAMQAGTVPNPPATQFQPMQQQQQPRQQLPAPAPGPLTHAPFSPSPMGAYNPYTMPYFRPPPPMMGPLPPSQHHLPNSHMLPPHMHQRAVPPSMGSRYPPPLGQYMPNFMMHPHMIPWQPSQESIGNGLLQPEGRPWQPQIGTEQIISSQPLLSTYPGQQEMEAGMDREVAEEEFGAAAAKTGGNGGGGGDGGDQGSGNWLLLPQHLMSTEHPVDEGSPQAPVPAWAPQSSNREETSQRAPSSKEAPTQPSSVQATSGGKSQAPPPQESGGGSKLGQQQGAVSSGSSEAVSSTTTSVSWPHNAKPSVQENTASVSKSNAAPASQLSAVVMGTSRVVESTAAVKDPATGPAVNKRPVAKAHRDSEKGPKAPVVSQQALPDQAPLPDTSVKAASDGKVARPAEGSGEQQRPPPAPQCPPQVDRKTGGQSAQVTAEGHGGHKRENHLKGSSKKDSQRTFSYDREFDFETANARFDKENLEEEFKHKARIADGGRKAGDLEEEEEEEVEDDEEGEVQSEAVYDKTKSFFDNMSCDGKNGGNSHTGRREERALNTETFGVSTVYGYRHGSRGGRGRGRGGYYRSRGYHGNSGRPRATNGETHADNGGNNNSHTGAGGRGGGGKYSSRYSRERQSQPRDHSQGQRRWNSKEGWSQRQSQPQVEKN